jgi:hypothetical protein
MKRTRRTILAANAIFISLLALSATAAAQNEQPNRGSASFTRAETIVIFVWESATPLPQASTEAADPKLSPGFASAGLGATATLREWQAHIAYTIRNGYPLAESWIGLDRDRADMALRQAAVMASTDADRMALRLLVNHFEDLHRWSAGLIDANRNLRLAEYYISETALENDPIFQKTSACGDFLASMLASGRFAEEASCQ